MFSPPSLSLCALSQSLFGPFNTPNLTDELGDQKRSGSRETADHDRLQGALKRIDPREGCFHPAKDRESHQRHSHGILETCLNVRKQDVRREGNETADDVRRGDGQRTYAGAL